MSIALRLKSLPNRLDPVNLAINVPSDRSQRPPRRANLFFLKNDFRLRPESPLPKRPAHKPQGATPPTTNPLA